MGATLKTTLPSASKLWLLISLTVPVTFPVTFPVRLPVTFTFTVLGKPIVTA